MKTTSNVNSTAGSVRQLPTGRWLATVTIGSGRGASKKTKSFVTKRAGQQWLATVKASGVPYGDAAEMTVAQAFTAYIDAKVLAPNTVETFEAARGRAIAQGIGAVRLENLKPSQVDAFTASLVRAGLAPATVNIYAAKLCAVLRFAAKDGALSFVPKAVKVRTSVVNGPSIAPADVKALYEASSEDFAPAILLGAYCGLRASEAAAVTVGDIDFTAGTITVSKAVDDRGAFVGLKTARSARVIPVPTEVLAQLGEACKGKGLEAPVAVNADGGILTTSSFAKTFAKTSAAARVDVTFHALRKFFATTLVAAGVNPVAAAKFLGDSVQTMLATYALELPTDAALARDAIGTAYAATVAA